MSDEERKEWYCYNFIYVMIYMVQVWVVNFVR